MSILEVIEVWIASLRASLVASGVEIRFEQSPPGRPNPSCALNLRRADAEADLLVWESGHADLSLADSLEEVKQEHFEDVRNGQVLADVLSKVATRMLVATSE